MKVYRYETPADKIDFREKTIFLAGPTVRGHQTHLGPSWRFEAIKEFERMGYGGSLIIPEFESPIESDKGKDWIPLWEHKGLKYSDVIMFWIPRTKELIGLTTNMEFGHWISRYPNKVVYGRPDDAYRMGYLDIMWHCYASEEHWPVNNRTIYNNLPDTIHEAMRRAHHFNTH